jgi:hypothetical protein
VVDSKGFIATKDFCFAVTELSTFLIDLTVLLKWAGASPLYPSQ